MDLLVTGKLIAGMNGPLFEQAKIPIGHAAILSRNAFDEIESWGMLDFEDSDYRKMFQKAKIKWTEENASDTGIWEFESEEEYRQALKINDNKVNIIEAKLHKAMALSRISDAR